MRSTWDAIHLCQDVEDFFTDRKMRPRASKGWRTLMGEKGVWHCGQATAIVMSIAASTAIARIAQLLPVRSCLPSEIGIQRKSTT